MDFMYFYLLLGPALLFSLAAMRVVERRHYRWDSRNPYKRFCKECDQQQAQMYCPSTKKHWWETQYEITNPSCSCHKECQDGRLF